ncbi:Mitochondrial outer membrane protein iml2 [Vermiconidia calcicola]|uniref:Mitochondrial outer membrane protein iml2 n=1 Tax=Vermiconidia calcicola TaxID=1690605 RepID=A0ACC3NYB8_9PEZI|nr:Mitochondrial outer membrane protein iml2 [Vermiconidia calcicola]
MTLFLRATLGFEKEVMEQAGARLAEAEEAAAEHQRRAIRDPSTAHRSTIYPPGAEYALCHAEAQLMSAVVAVLNESLTESLRGFYKLRRAFTTLHEIHEAEKLYLQKQGKSEYSSRSSAASSTSNVSNTGPSNGSDARKSGAVTPSTSDDEDDFEFVDAKDDPLDLATPICYQGHLKFPDMSSLNMQGTSGEKLNAGLPTTGQPIDVAVDSKSAAAEADQEVDLRTLTQDPIDLFIHSGTGLCFGLLQLMLSMIPPAFGRLLSLFSFRGDREAGLRMLWSATKFKKDINGAMAGLITLGFHNAALAFCDILSKDALPEARLDNLLTEMRELYPKSKLWLLEEVRMLARGRKLEEAVDRLATGPKSSLKQVEALGLFEMSLSCMYLHRYEDCAESFMKCVGMNNWGHALYYYIAGICYIELYRIHKTSDPAKAKEYAAKADKHLHEVPLQTGKKRLMAKQLPFDVFVGRKIQKWDARAKSQGCSFVDAVGVSPVVEMTYFWSGFMRMSPKHIQTSLERLAWSEDTKHNPRWEKESADERAILSLMKAVCHRYLGDTDLALSTFTKDVLSWDLGQLKASGGEDGDAEYLRKCSEELTIVENWEAYDLDARIGLKIRTARETLKRIDAARS